MAILYKFVQLTNWMKKNKSKQNEIKNKTEQGNNENSFVNIAWKSPTSEFAHFYNAIRIPSNAHYCAIFLRFIHRVPSMTRSTIRFCTELAAAALQNEKKQKNVHTRSK